MRLVVLLFSKQASCLQRLTRRLVGLQLLRRLRLVLLSVFALGRTIKRVRRRGVLIPHLRGGALVVAIESWLVGFVPVSYLLLQKTPLMRRRLVGSVGHNPS